MSVVAALYDVDTAMVRIRATAFPDADDVMRKSLLEPGDPAWIARFLEDRAHGVSES